MVDDRVEHQAIIAAQGVDVGPIPQSRVHAAVVYDRKAIVRGIREEREDMHPGDGLAQVLPQEAVQGLERGFVRGMELVAVGDEEGVALGEALRRGWRRGKMGMPLAKGRQAALKFTGGIIAAPGAIEEAQEVRE